MISGASPSERHNPIIFKWFAVSCITEAKMPCHRAATHCVSSHSPADLVLVVQKTRSKRDAAASERSISNKGLNLVAAARSRTNPDSAWITTAGRHGHLCRWWFSPGSSRRAGKLARQDRVRMREGTLGLLPWFRESRCTPLDVARALQDA